MHNNNTESDCVPKLDRAAPSLVFIRCMSEYAMAPISDTHVCVCFDCVRGPNANDDIARSESDE